jgi:tetratricopeptide (TPR) repeat protein
MEAGLSLARVAGSQLTRAAIFLVETGQARPSRRTLKLIASRTGKPLTFFLEPDQTEAASAAKATSIDPRLAEIEAMITISRFKPAIASARRLLAGLEPGDVRMQARVRLRLAEAQLHSGQATAALPNLRLAGALLASAGELRLQAEGMDLLGLALKRLEDSDALAAYHEALRLCRAASPEGKDLEARILGHIGAAHASTHDWEAAVHYYELALDAASNMVDLSFLERMYNDIGLAEMGADNLPSALSYFQKALALADVSREPTILARIENNIGLVLVGLGELDSAESHLLRSLGICEEIPLEVGRGHVLCSLAELEIARGRPQQARRRSREAVALTSRLGERLTEAFAHQLAGQAAEMHGERGAADAAFHRALQLLADQKARHRLMECHLTYAAILESRDDMTGALRHTKEALLVAEPQMRAQIHPGHRPALSGMQLVSSPATGRLTTSSMGSEQTIAS